jgi:hypothetical protein
MTRRTRTPKSHSARAALAHERFAARPIREQEAILAVLAERRVLLYARTKGSVYLGGCAVRRRSAGRSPEVAAVALTVAAGVRMRAIMQPPAVIADCPHSAFRTRDGDDAALVRGFARWIDRRTSVDQALAQF